jgi:hypothetical protein
VRAAHAVILRKLLKSAFAVLIPLGRYNTWFGSEGEEFEFWARRKSRGIVEFTRGEFDLDFLDDPRGGAGIITVVVQAQMLAPTLATKRFCYAYNQPRRSGMAFATKQTIVWC